jgi:CMP-N,N'-diacetyllegionaminic acid synthase
VLQNIQSKLLLLKCLTIIPARAGSKGVPGKNSKLLDGTPLVQYSIDVALAAALPGTICVSSDDPEVLQIARNSGVLAILRPPELANDTSPVTDTVRHALETVEDIERGEQLDSAPPYAHEALVLLQPTAPIREPWHIQQAAALIENNPSAHSVISVCQMRDGHPARLYRMENGLLESFFPDLETARRQDLPPAYHRNGSIYLVRRAAFESENALMVEPSFAYVMDIKYLANIDDLRDWMIAETLVKAWKSQAQSY